MKNMKYRHVFVFNPQDNGGEALSLVTDFINNGHGDITTQQELTLSSYCNSATFNLSGISITPEILRQLANELESKRNLVESEAKRFEEQNAN